VPILGPAGLGWKRSWAGADRPGQPSTSRRGRDRWPGFRPLAPSTSPVLRPMPGRVA